jgi:dipeptidyl aminopeptidase/acylaminoacyl peptidase
VAVTPDGARIVTGSADKTARVWDASTGAELHQLKGHDGSVLAVAVTPDGARIVTGSVDKTARVWDASTGAELYQLKGHDGSVLAVAVTPDGARIVTGSADKTVRVWDASTGVELLQLKGHDGSVRGVAVTPDGARFVTGSDDRTARVWDSSTGVELLKLKGHARPILAVAVTRDGARVITGSSDTTARVWDASTGAELFRLRGHNRSALDVAVTPDGARIIIGSDNTAWVWALAQLRPLPQQNRFDTATNRQAVVDRAKAVVPRCLTVEERKDFLLRPTPPGWCIDMRKYPYDTEYWRAWRAKKEPADSSTAEAYADFADKALMRGGAIGVALEAAELSIKFDPPPKKIWFIINQAHAHMFLGQTEKARQEYLSHHGEKLEMQSGKLWDTAVVEDFQKLRENGLGDDLMVEIEQQFKSALPVEADK